MQSVKVAGIRFRPAGKILQYAVHELTLEPGDKCVAESEDGIEIATVVMPSRSADNASAHQTFKPIIRKATVRDLEREEAYKQRAGEALVLCRRRVQETDLPMKPLAVDFTLDGRKALFYFTAEDRVDFRDLVRYLASQLKTRIEMRQIGVRDEAKKLGGYGVCGQPLCCATFITDFTPISVRMAKEQGLALNPSRISGVCGRLKCCLAYELPIYKAIKDQLPSIGEEYVTEAGPGSVTAVTVVGETFEVTLHESGEQVLVQLPSAEDRQYHCKGGGCKRGTNCGQAG